MANGDLKVGIDDVVASAASGVLRAFDARKIRVDGTRFTDLVQSGFGVRFEIWAGGKIDPDIFGPRGPGGGFGGRAGFMADEESS
jgi:hypothetical protein